MKESPTIYAIGIVAFVTGLVMRILQVPYGESLMFFSVLGLGIYSSYLLMRKDKRVKELEHELWKKKRKEENHGT